MVLLRFDKQKKKWIEVTKEQKQEGDIYLDRNLMKCLIHFKKQQQKDNDRIIIISGMEGSGKSSIEGGILEFISNGEFNPKNDLIGANYLDGLEKIEKVKHGGWLGFDEGNSFFLSTETTTKEHKDLHKIFSIFRQKNLFIIICLPSFFRLGTYFAMDRSCALLRTYFKKGERGFFAFYGGKVKDKLYREGKPNYNDNAIKPTFRGRFTKCNKIENKDYKAFKMITLTTEIDKAKARIKKPKTETEMRDEYKREIIERTLNKKGIEVAEILGLTDGRIGQLRKEIRMSKKKQLQNSNF